MTKINKDKGLLINNNANMIIKSSSPQINLNFPATEAYTAVLVEPQIKMQTSWHQL